MRRPVAVAAGAAGVATAAVLPALWFRWRYLVATVDGRSMEPTLRAGDRLLVRRGVRPRTGQIVVVRVPDPPLVYGPPDVPLTAAEEAALLAAPERPEAAPPPGGRLVVKRAVAVPGDPVPRELVPVLRDVPEDVVPPGFLVVLGDNADASWDSRDYGFVRPGQCVGVALRRMDD
ncbi:MULTISPECIES: S26 family signal peptidase [Thermomonosporaceae]|uniref:S26 family signal peptidase n=1 Tax=Thermomonosporaceae TaxID=2012 RepID=UPI00255AAE8C|nr:MULTISPECIES: S26 family signal peptidase [Thermomonosporaceae]MDL4777145.1 S26 family signal peptidase [Actinomadura xylanilytica]